MFYGLGFGRRGGVIFTHILDNGGKSNTIMPTLQPRSANRRSALPRSWPDAWHRNVEELSRLLPGYLWMKLLEIGQQVDQQVLTL